MKPESSFLGSCADPSDAQKAKVLEYWRWQSSSTREVEGGFVPRRGIGEWGRKPSSSPATLRGLRRAGRDSLAPSVGKLPAPRLVCLIRLSASAFRPLQFCHGFETSAGIAA